MGMLAIKMASQAQGRAGESRDEYEAAQRIIRPAAATVWYTEQHTQLVCLGFSQDTFVALNSTELMEKLVSRRKKKCCVLKATGPWSSRFLLPLYLNH